MSLVKPSWRFRPDRARTDRASALVEQLLLLTVAKKSTQELRPAAGKRL